MNLVLLPDRIACIMSVLSAMANQYKYIIASQVILVKFRGSSYPSAMRKMLSYALTCSLSVALILALVLERTNCMANEKLAAMNSGSATAYYSPGLESDASDTLSAFSDALANMENSIGLTLGYKPALVLISNGEDFRRAAGSEFITAYANAAKGLIVMDYSRVLTKPFTLSGTLRHESVHLILGEHIKQGLPRWLNEGAAQFYAGSSAEIILSMNSSTLGRAALADRLIPLSSIGQTFPADRNNMVLAYEESLSFAKYLEGEFGSGSLKAIIKEMAKGANVSDAVMSITGKGLEEIEESWQIDVRAKTSWLVYIMGHFYELLFLLAALLTIVGFVRMVIKYRRYRDEDEEELPGQYN